MKTWAIRFFLAGLLVAAGAWGWKTLFPGPETIIRKRLLEVARTASVEGSEGNFVRLAKAQKLAGFFTQDVEVMLEIPGYHSAGINGRAELQQAVLMARSRSSTLKFKLVDVNVAVAPDGTSAVAHFTGEATITGETGIQAEEMKANLVKQDGEWLIKRVETVPTLRE